MAHLRPSCGACGKGIRLSTAVWVVFGDKDRPALEPWPLHKKCFPKDGKVMVAEWVNNDNGEPVLREFETTRYVQVTAPKAEEGDE